MIEVSKALYDLVNYLDPTHERSVICEAHGLYAESEPCPHGSFAILPQNSADLQNWVKLEPDDGTEVWWCLKCTNDAGLVLSERSISPGVYYTTFEECGACTIAAETEGSDATSIAGLGVEYFFDWERTTSEAGYEMWFCPACVERMGTA